MNILSEKGIVDAFINFYFFKEDNYFNNTRWLGVKTIKFPIDMWVYQEIIYDCRPDIIIETGTWMGGSALYMATICDAINNGRIVTIDIIGSYGLPKHKRIEYLTGSSVSDYIIVKLKKRIKPNDKVMVILDSDHHMDHVYKELKLYSDFVTKGQYLILEDTSINGHPINDHYGPGPMEALEKFMAEDNRFESDTSREKFFATFNPKGFLKRKE